MGRKARGSKNREGKGRAGRNAADLQPVPDAAAVAVETEATITGLEGGESLDEMLANTVNEEGAQVAQLVPARGGDELAPASDEPGGEPLAGAPWYERISVRDEEDAVVTTADWSGYAQAAMAGGCETADEAAKQADELMHEQLMRQSRLMLRVQNPE